MRDQLIRYIDLLFAGAPDAAEMKQEILQNTLDRYDDLIAQGKAPEAAYRLSISGIGDINEILGGEPQISPTAPSTQPEVRQDAGWKKVLRAAAIALYIVCAVPLFLIGNEIGLCLLLVIIAVATAMMVIAGKDTDQNRSREEDNRVPSPRKELHRSVGAVIWAVGLCAYFLLSFATQAWYITWVIFLITPCVQGLVNACMDLKEAQ